MSILWLSRHWDDVKDEKPGLIVIDESYVIMLDGKVIVETKYSKVEIARDGTALLTIAPDMAMKVKLGT